MKRRHVQRGTTKLLQSVYVIPRGALRFNKIFACIAGEHAVAGLRPAIKHCTRMITTYGCIYITLSSHA